MITFSADWILPMTGPPIRHGFVALDEGRIVAVGDRAPKNAITLGPVAILPGLVNAHTHLELSCWRECIPPSANFNDWVTSLMSMRRTQSDPAAPAIGDAVRWAIAQAKAAGTGLIGDVSNTLVTVPLLREAAMPAHVFHELTGFNHPDPAGRVEEARARVHAVGVNSEDVRVSLAPHAPYSVSPGLFAAIKAALDCDPNVVSTVHLGESPDEVQLLRHGTGVTRTMLERLGVWTDEWRIPNASPTEYLDRLGVLNSRLLVVHGVQFDADDLARLTAIGSTLVSCPRSNRYVGVGDPPLEAFYASGVSIAFGTDSLASVADLSIFSEIAQAHRIAPRVSPRRLLESATLRGAHALGFESEFGSIEAGKRDALIAVKVPPRVSDVEEYLVGGIEPEAIGWLEELSRSDA
jgi:cytosine/adenosine deaminase-related metal-dependent hydrolase